jgi:aminoglycoside 3-N-acetyltransferase
MNPLLKKILKRIVPSTRRNQLRRLKRHAVLNIKHREKLNLDEMRKILVDDFGLRKGDNIIVSSGFGSLNAEFTPQDLLHLLQEIITEDGLIMMPYYPPFNSTEWAAKKLVFDMRKTKSGMGILTNVFSKSPDVYMSKHPTKAVCAWGKGAKEIVKDHDKATTPFYWDSPYGKMLKSHSKSLGLGVKNITTMHAVEDILTNPHDYYYQPNKYELDYIDSNGNKEIIKTLIHDENIMNRSISPGDYVRSLNCHSYKRIKIGYDYSYVVDNDDLFDNCKENFKKGHTRLRK